MKLTFGFNFARKRARRAFTLIEMVMSTVIISIILLACTSVLTIAARSINNRARTEAVQAMSGRTAGEQMADDLKLALSFSEQTSTAVTFTVPDRNGDGQPDTLRYAWAGIGAPLTRQYNGGSIVTVAPSVQNLGFSFTSKTQGTKQPAESPEQLLIFHDGASGSNIQTFSETTSAWQGQYFHPSTPAGTLSFKVTRLQLYLARKASSTGTLGVEIRAADAAQKPTGAALGTASVNVASLAGAAWVNIPLTAPLSGLNPASGYCIVLTGSASSAIETTSWDNASTDANTSYCTSFNGGSTWLTPSTSSALQFYVYGTITTP